MSDMVLCDYCHSDYGFRVDGGHVYCKLCGHEHQPEPLTTKDFVTHTGWHPENQNQE
jgi:hypothetical protein